MAQEILRLTKCGQQNWLFLLYDKKRDKYENKV